MPAASKPVVAARPQPRTDGGFAFTANVAAAEWTRATDATCGIRANPDTTLVSTTLGRTVSLSVCLPIDYDTSGINYPVVWHLHGIQGTNRTGAGWWQARYQRARLAGLCRAHITVFPNGLNWSMWADNFDGSMLMYRFLRHELWQHIHATYRTLGEAPRYNVLTGFSMGGRGALAHALRDRTQAYREPSIHAQHYSGVAVYGFPAGDETQDFDSSTDGWAPAVVYPGAAPTNVERQQWRANSPQGWIDAAALSGYPVRVRYGVGDTLKNGAGPIKTLLQNAGTALDWPANSDLPGVSAHNAQEYWAGTDNDSDAMFAFYEARFAGG